MTDNSKAPASQTNSDEGVAILPLLNAKAWALGFLLFSLVVAVVFSQVLIDFIANAH